MSKLKVNGSVTLLSFVLSFDIQLCVSLVACANYLKVVVKLPTKVAMTI